MLSVRGVRPAGFALGAWARFSIKSAVRPIPACPSARDLGSRPVARGISRRRFWIAATSPSSSWLIGPLVLAWSTWPVACMPLLVALAGANAVMRILGPLSNFIPQGCLPFELAESAGPVSGRAAAWLGLGAAGCACRIELVNCAAMLCRCGPPG